MKSLGTRLLEGYFGYITEKIPGNNPTLVEFSKSVATEAFYFVALVVTSGSDRSQSISVKRARNEVSACRHTQIKRRSRRQ